MRSVPVRAIVFSVGAFAFWLQHFLRVLGVIHPVAPVPPLAVFDAFRYATSLALSSGVGTLLGLAAARGAARSIPVWLTAPAGVVFALLTQPVTEAVRTAGLPIPGGVLGYSLVVAVGAAIFAWLFARSAQLLRRYAIARKEEAGRVNPNVPERIGFWLALSPWILAIGAMLYPSGFG